MNKLKGLFVSVCILVVMSPSCILAQAQQPRQRADRDETTDPRIEQGIDMMFREMDTTREGRISEEEWMDAQEKQFRRLDGNRDGFVTRDEVRSDLEKMRDEQERMQRPRRTPK
ncbi:MAG: hypothetical protein AB2L11_01250 [Syntrophobacteraceae bacterium]